MVPLVGGRGEGLLLWLPAVLMHPWPGRPLSSPSRNTVTPCVHSTKSRHSYSTRAPNNRMCLSFLICVCNLVCRLIWTLPPFHTHGALFRTRDAAFQIFLYPGLWGSVRLLILGLQNQNCVRLLVRAASFCMQGRGLVPRYYHPMRPLRSVTLYQGFLNHQGEGGGWG